MITCRSSILSMIPLTKGLILAIATISLCGCYVSSPEWELNLGLSEFPHTPTMISDEEDNSYVISQFALSKVDATGSIVWVVNSDIIEDESVSFAKFIEKNESELSVFLFSETALYHLAIDETGNVLSNQSYAFPEGVTLIGPNPEEDNLGRIEIHIVKHDDQSYGVLNHSFFSFDHNYFRLDDSGITLLAQFQLENLSYGRFWNFGKQYISSNGYIDCVSSDSIKNSGELINNVKCFDSANGSLLYDLESPTNNNMAMTSFIMGDKLAYAGFNQVEIHDLSGKELIFAYPTDGYGVMLAADTKGVIVVYSSELEFDTETEPNPKLALISWEGNEIWSRDAKDIFPMNGGPVYGTSANGKYFITYYSLNEDEDPEIDGVETIEISANGHKLHTYNHKGGAKPPLENPITRPTITTISSNGKPRMLSYSVGNSSELAPGREALLYLQQF